MEVRRQVREELAVVREMARGELSRIEHILDDRSYDLVGADWSDSYGEYYQDRDALRALLRNEPLWNPTDDEIDALGSVEAALRDLMRYVRAYCNVYSLVRLLQAHVAEVIQHGNDGGTATGVVQAAPAGLAASPDVELAELIRAMDAPQDRSRAETGLPWELRDWEEWSQAICDREPIAAVRVAAAVARCAEDLYRGMQIEVDGRFQNIRSSMEEWILCPCDLHANRLDGMWRSARELAHYGHPDKSRHPEAWALGQAKDALFISIAFVMHAESALAFVGHRAVQTEPSLPVLSRVGKMPGSAAHALVAAFSTGLGIDRVEAFHRVMARIRQATMPWALGETDPLADDCCCSLCGANWAEGRYTEGCEECDGGALLRPCGDCDGTRGVVLLRFVAASKQVGKARWAKVDWF